jgi:hypothetical protein
MSSKIIGIFVPLHTIEACWGGVDAQLHSFFTSTIDGDEGLASNLGRFVQETKPVPVVQKAGWAPELVQTLRRG